MKRDTTIKKVFKFFAAMLAFTLVASGVYYKVPSARGWVNARFPEVKILAAKIIGPDDAGTAEALSAPETVAATEPVAASTVSSETVADTPIPVAMPEATDAAPQAQAPAGIEAAVVQSTAQQETVDLAQLSQSRADWPKVVSLKRTVVFPAVLNGKVIGSLRAGVGSLTRIVLIKESQLGLEYQGGGAMVEVTDTDLVERVLAARLPAS